MYLNEVVMAFLVIVNRLHQAFFENENENIVNDINVLVFYLFLLQSILKSNSHGTKIV